MPDTIEINQKAAPASSSTQIGVQYVGMTPVQAAQQTIDLFMENFPKLQALAQETAERRATEFCDEVMKRLEEKQVRDFSPFSDPDVQFVTYEAQKNYARFGNKETMDVLADLIIQRIQNDDKSHFKTIVDNAIPVACQLSSHHLNCLSALFILTRVKFPGIRTIEDIRRLFDYISRAFDLKNIKYKNEISFLSFMRCIQIELPDVAKIYSQLYNLPKQEIESIMPDCIKIFNTDYGISDVGIILAIVNAEQKSHYRFDPHIWIHD